MYTWTGARRGAVRLMATADDSISQSGHWMVPMTCFEDLCKQQASDSGNNQNHEIASFPASSSSEEPRVRGVTFSPVVELEDPFDESDLVINTQSVQTDSGVTVYNLEDKDAATDSEKEDRGPQRATIAASD